MCKFNKKKGFTLTEVIVVVAILGILMAIAFPKLSGFLQRARITADQSTLRTLNTSTVLYGANLQKFGNDIFIDFDTDEKRMEELLIKGFIDYPAKPNVENTKFTWVVEDQLWMILSGDKLIPLSPLGNSFVDISSAMINLINQRNIDKGSYGRTWGDFRFTDIGLDPKDWENPISHVYYKPAGSLLRISPEEGYKFVVKDLNGNTKELSYSLKWDLIYDVKNGKWYYHSISDVNIVDINTLTIQQ